VTILALDKFKPTPLHYQLTEELKAQFKKGDYKVGDHFTTDKELMEKFNVSITTARRAVAELVREGFLERIPGKGTFVKKDFVEDSLRLMGFFEQIREKGAVPSAKIISLKEVELTPFMLEEVPSLNIFDAEKVFLIKKVQMMNGEPVVYLQSYWPLELGREISKYDLTKRGIYEIATQELGISIDEAEQTIFSAAADEETSKYLGIKAKEPVLSEERIGYSEGQPMELSLSSYPADRYKYKVKMSRNESKDRGGILS